MASHTNDPNVMKSENEGRDLALIRRPSIPFLTGLLVGMSLGVLCSMEYVAQEQRVIKDRIEERYGPGSGKAVLAKPESLLPDFASPSELPNAFDLTPPWVPAEKTADARTSARPLHRTAVVAVREIKPAYPLLAQHLGIEGPVSVTVAVDKQGVPISCVASGGNAILEKAAMDAASEWQFRPATQDGRPVASAFAIRFEFKLKPDKSSADV